MSSTVIVSARGQITLPAEFRKKYHMEEGDVLILEERDGEILLKPAKVFEVEYFDDAEISKWVSADKFSSGEKERLLKKLGKQK